MYLSKSDIEKTERIKRLNIINSVSGIKSANLLGTISPKGEPNLAIISSVIHLGSNPALLGYIARPAGEISGQSLVNIKETKVYTMNHIHSSFIENAHYTSAKFPKGVSEFEKCSLGEEYVYDFPAPFVKESVFKTALSLVDIVPIKQNNTSLVIGQIEHLIIPDNCVENNMHIDLEKINTVGISGLNSYYSLKKIRSFPYARVHELPDFE